MKLYTEEQVMKAFKDGYDSIVNSTEEYYQAINEYPNLITPIELPDDNEDAGKIALYISSVRDEKQAVFFVAGAMKYNEWIKNQIINQNK